MISPEYFWIPMGLYLAGWLGQSYRYWADKGDRVGWSGGLLGVGWGAHGILLGIVAVQHTPGVPYLLNASAWLAIAIYFIISLKVRSTVFPYVFPPLAIALLITAFFGSRDTVLLSMGFDIPPDTLRNLLTVHIVAVLGGTMLFGLACFTSGVYLYEEHTLKRKRTPRWRLPALARLEVYNHRSITLGFFLMTAGLLLGLFVAGLRGGEREWFTLRQIVPLITWVVYAMFLLSHDLQGRRGRYGAIWSILGFGVVCVSLAVEISQLIDR